MNMINNIGAVWGVTGKCHYFSKNTCFSLYANRSAESLKSHLPDIKTTLFTDNVDIPRLNGFDNIQQLPDLPPNGPFYGKIKTLQLSPYAKTLFLDADTMVLDSRVSLIFEMLEKFDIVGVHAPVIVPGLVPDKYAHIPISFPEINTGVIGFRDNEKTRSLLELWYNCYHFERQYKNNGNIAAGNDQASFRYALWETDVLLGILPDQYNYRNKQPVLHDITQKNSIRNTVIHHARSYYPEIVV